MNSVVERLYEYDNYRFFLRDYFEEQKRIKSCFSHRYFAQRAGFSSSSFCAHVIEGKRNLTAKSLAAMTKGLGLTGKAAAHFEALVLYNQAKAIEEREHCFRRLERIRKSTKFYRINQQQYAYYDEWYYPVIRELVVYSEWGGDYEKLGKMVRPAVTGERARKAVDTLLEIGLIVKTADGRYAQNSEAVTAEDVPPSVTRKTRKEYVLMSIDALETLGVGERHVAGVTVALSERQYREIVARLDDVRKQILAGATEDSEVDRVYQVNFQAYPLSQPIKMPGAPGGKGGKA